MIPRFDNASLTRAHWFAKGEADAEGFEGQVLSAKHLLSPFYTYNIASEAIEVND